MLLLVIVKSSLLIYNVKSQTFIHTQKAIMKTLRKTQFTQFKERFWASLKRSKVEFFCLSNSIHQTPMPKVGTQERICNQQPYFYLTSWIFFIICKKLIPLRCCFNSSKINIAKTPETTILFVSTRNKFNDFADVLEELLPVRKEQATSWWWKFTQELREVNNNKIISFWFYIIALSLLALFEGLTMDCLCSSLI